MSLTGEEVDNHLQDDRVLTTLATRPDAFPTGDSLLGPVFDAHPREFVDIIPFVEAISGHDETDSELAKCKSTLVVLIGAEESVRSRILEAIGHVTTVCPDTKELLFYGMHWDSAVWATLRGAFEKREIECWLKAPFQAPARLT